MADSIRKRILNEVQSILERIDGVGDTGGPKAIATEINRFPALFVQPGEDRINEYIGDRIDRDLAFVVIMWIRTQNNVLEAQENFLPKVLMAMTADHTLGGLAIDVGESDAGISAPFPLVDGQPDAAIAINYVCKYRVKRNDPYSQ